MDISAVRQLLWTHYTEAASGLVDKPPSRLARGEATEKQFYIMKIDLARSTAMLERSRKSTYLRLAHTFLSTIDRIAQEWGADPDQMEYAGDSVLAYFPAEKAGAEDVMAAACYARAAVKCIQELDSTLNSLSLRCKVVLHFDTLMVAKIGPRGGSILNAIGHPIHRVAKIEKDLAPDEGWATTEFQARVALEARRYLSEVYDQEPSTVPNAGSSALAALTLGLSPPLPSQNHARTLQGLLAPQPAYHTILGSLMNPTTPKTATEEIFPYLPTIAAPPKPTVIGYRLRWLLLGRALELPN